MILDNYFAMDEKNLISINIYYAKKIKKKENHKILNDSLIID